jgi:hypothetical protein
MPIAVQTRYDARVHMLDKLSSARVKPAHHSTLRPRVCLGVTFQAGAEIFGNSDCCVPSRFNPGSHCRYRSSSFPR